MEDDERTKDWAAREAAKHLRKEQESANAKERTDRHERLKDEGGLEHFARLREWMSQQTKSFNEQVKKRAFEVGEIKPVGGADWHHFFEVSDPNRERLAMKIFYRSAPHGITVEQQGTAPKQYSVEVGDKDNLRFETRDGQPKTIEDLGTELLDSFHRP